MGDGRAMMPYLCFCTKLHCTIGIRCFAPVPPRFLTKPKAYGKILRRLVQGVGKDRFVTED